MKEKREDEEKGNEEEKEAKKDWEERREGLTMRYGGGESGNEEREGELVKKRERMNREKTRGQKENTGERRK